MRKKMQTLMKTMEFAPSLGRKDEEIKYSGRELPKYPQVLIVYIGWCHLKTLKWFEKWPRVYHWEWTHNGGETEGLSLLPRIGGSSGLWSTHQERVQCKAQKMQFSSDLATKIHTGHISAAAQWTTYVQRTQVGWVFSVLYSPSPLHSLWPFGHILK